jgi:hypothetical protein
MPPMIVRERRYAIPKNESREGHTRTPGVGSTEEGVNKGFGGKKKCFCIKLHIHGW